MLPVGGARVVDLPEGLSVEAAISTYEADPDVEYANPDYYLYPAQAQGTSADPAEYYPDSTDFVEPAVDEPAPTDPDPDPTTSAPEPQLAPLVPNDPGFPNVWGLDNSGQVIDPDPNDGNPGVAGKADADVDAPEAWGLTTGGPDTVVAVIDDGVDIGHPDLANNVWTNPDEIAGNGVDDDGNTYVDDIHGWDFAPENGNPAGDNTVYDGSQDDHGTHMAGTIAAEGNNGFGVAGVGWRTKIMPVNFMKIQPSGREAGLLSDAAKALHYAYSEGAQLSNNSYGCRRGECADLDIDTLMKAVADAERAGHLLVAAAGNSQPGTNNDQAPFYPASFDSPNVVSVAATKSDDTIAHFSNYGATSVDLAAPGDAVYSTEPNNAYGYRNGTSSAAAYVSGAAALLESRSPELGYSQIKERLLQSAERKDGLVGKTVTGGRLNAADALEVKTTETSLSAAPLQVTYGAAVTLSGKLTSSGQALGGKEVVVEKREEGETAFSTIDTVATTGTKVVTAADGSFSYAASKPRKHTDYRARFAGERAARLGASMSTPAHVDVRAVVTLSVAQTDLKLGNSRPISGYVSPNHASRYVTVTIDKRNSTWAINRNVQLNTNFRYYTPFKPGSTGVYDVTTRFPGDADHLANTSVRRTFKVVK